MSDGRMGGWADDRRMSPLTDADADGVVLHPRKAANY